MCISMCMSMCMSHAQLISSCLNFYFAPIYFQLPWHCSCILFFWFDIFMSTASRGLALQCSSLPVRELLSHELTDSTASESESDSSESTIEDYSEILHSTVDLLQRSDAWGVDLYVDALSVLSS